MCIIQYWQTSSWILTTAREVWSGLKLTQTVTPIVNSDLLHVVVDSQLNAYVFIACFYVFFLKVKHMYVYVFYSQVNIFNIYDIHIANR